jgi:signal transduction histidine kinase
MLLSAQRETARRGIEEAARTTSVVIDGEIDRARSVLAILAKSHALLTDDMATFYDHALAANAGPGGWVILYDATGRQLVNTRLPRGPANLVRPDVAAMQETIRAGHDVVSDIRWGPALSNTLVLVEHPFTLPDGSSRVLSQAFSPSYFARAIAGRAIPASWRSSIIDRNGKIIARSHRGDEFAGRDANPVVEAARRSGVDGAFRHVTADGFDAYDYFVRSPLSGWTVVVSAPVTEVEAAVWQSVRVTLVGLTLAILAALALAVLSGRRLLRFVSRASVAARALGEGRAAPLRPSAIREMEELNVALREAGERLEQEMRSRALAEEERNAALDLERAARAHAERQNAAKDEFLAMLGHELRNPLSAISSAVAVLDAAPANAERARDVLRRQSAHLRALVNDLLEVNRALMGKLSLRHDPIDLATVVAACIETLRTAGATGNCQLVPTLAPAPVLGDATRLAQIVDNILDNAIKYSPDGGAVRIAVGMRDGSVRLIVSDEGEGIAPALLPQVFNVFVQGEQTLQRARGGLGIGLTLVRRLVELHGGSIAIDSPGEGLGTTVTVRLPVNRDV